MNIILIRKVKKDDAQAIADAIKIAYIPLFQTQKLSQTSIDEQLLLNDSYHLAERFKGNYFYVAKDSKEKVVGLIGLRKNDEGTVYDRISTFFVLPEQRGKGVGKLLFKTVCDLAQQNKVKKLVVSSSLFAEKIYKHWGFKKIKIITKSYSNGDLYKNIWMEKKMT